MSQAQWQDFGAAAAGIAIGVGAGIAIGACIVATVGICAGVVGAGAVAFGLAGGALAGSVAAGVSYDLSSGSKNDNDRASTKLAGAIGGVASAGIGAVTSRLLAPTVIQVTGTLRSAIAPSNLRSGSGPVPGVLEASANVRSVAALRNYHPSRGGVEYVFDPTNGTFAVGRPAAHAGLQGSPHQQLAQSIGADPQTVVGGTLTRGSSGAFYTTENSGHFWRNWTPEVRQSFVRTMEGYGLNVEH